MKYAIGLHPDISADEYHADALGDVPTLSSSVAGVLVEQSPLHAWWAHPRMGKGGYEATEATDRGSILHKLLLGKGEDVVPVDAKDWRTDKAKDTRAAIRANGGIPVLAAALTEHERTAKIVRARLEANGIVLDGASEVTGLWKSDGVLCRMRMDHLKASGDHVIIDLKSTQSAAPDAVAKSMVIYGADVQRAAYMDGYETICPDAAGRTKMLYAFFEAEAPHAVLVTEMAGTMRELGERKWKRARALWKRCLADGMGPEHWPGYASGVVRIEAPAWALAKDLECELNQMEVSNGKSVPF